MDAELKTYIGNRYYRYMEFSKYHCSRAKMQDQAIDVLNEVILALLSKNESKVQCLYDSISGDRREIDWYILRMIKLNIYSPTSPYQSKLKPIPNANIDYLKLNIEDCEYEESDRPAEILAQFNQVREIFNNLCLCERDKKVFEHRFFCDLPFSEWQGTESKKELYEIYKKTAKLIKMKINKKCLI